MTKKRLRLLSVALLALMVIIMAYFCCIAIPTQEASADIEYILSDVTYVDFPANFGNFPSVSFFKGYRGDPTVGSSFAYGLDSLHRGYALPTGWVGFEFDPKDFPTVDYVIPFTNGIVETGYYFTISFDCNSGAYYAYEEFDGIRYKTLGYFNFKNKEATSIRFEIKLLLDEVSNVYYLRGTAFANIVFMMSPIENFSGQDGEFVSVTISYTNNPEYSIGSFTTRMLCARNYYCTLNFNNKNQADLVNQSFLNSYSLACYSKNLYDFDNIFNTFDTPFASTIEDALLSTYNSAYKQGYNDGYNNGDVGGMDSSNNWLVSLFGSVTKFFNIKIFGDITLATVIFIPLILSIILFVLKLVRG